MCGSWLERDPLQMMFWCWIAPRKLGAIFCRHWLTQMGRRGNGAISDLKFQIIGFFLRWREVSDKISAEVCWRVIFQAGAWAPSSSVPVTVLFRPGVERRVRAGL